MTVEGLLRELQQLIYERPELRDCELRFAYQPHYPLYEDLGELVQPAQLYPCAITPKIAAEYELDKGMNYVLLAADETLDMIMDNDPQFFETMDEAEDAASDPSKEYVYLTGGIDSGYLPGAAARQMGWR